MMGRLQAKRVLVTAAANGIGRACAEACQREGAHVVATDRDPAGLAVLASSGIETHLVDGTNASAVTSFVDSQPVFDGLIHCIGYVHQGTVLQCDADAWHRSFQLNVDTFYLLLRACLPRMVEAKAGSITCIASIASSLKGFPNRAAYGATKAALIGLTKSVAADYVASGIRCNAVCPGTVTSPSLLQRIRDIADNVGGIEKATQMFVSRQPMNRLGTPEEIAALCVYLASDESRFMTGQAIAVDGGISI